MSRQEIERRVATDADPVGLAWGLVEAFRRGDHDLIGHLAAAAVHHGLVGKVVTFLVDLAVPHQVSFQAGAVPEQRYVQGLVLARGTGISDTYAELLAALEDKPPDEAVRYLVSAALLVADLVEFGLVAAPVVTFASWHTS